ncbi:uncharacterized protein LOC143878964 [Tasmannia lanceolata]|uniref:uncharacterized protein LOC143878964 n=1 Tax=Tasmannia lanceolata TaxID=3420 RepID=UPI0040649DC0
MLARKIHRLSYFWTTLEADCFSFVKTCHLCQIHANLIHVPPSELHSLTSLWPFSIWGIDIIGKISPRSSNGHEYILVAIDYFTKKSVRTSTGATPYSLTYGMKAVLPIELKIPTLRILMESDLSESEWARIHHQELCMMDEKMLKAAYHVQGYQRRLERAFNKKIRIRELREGDMVLRKCRAPIFDQPRKFRPN